MITISALMALPDGSVTKKKIAPGLESLQAEIGGFLEGIQLRPDVICYFDEEGQLKGLPYNETATRWLSKFGHQFRLVGPMLVVGLTKDGDDTDVPQDVLDQLL